MEWNASRRLLFQVSFSIYSGLKKRYAGQWKTHSVSVNIMKLQMLLIQSYIKLKIGIKALLSVIIQFFRMFFRAFT